MNTTDASPVRPCPVCEGLDHGAPCIQRDGYALVSCQRCGTLFVGQDPAGIDFQALYGEGYYRGGHEAVFADYTGQARARRRSAWRRLMSLRWLEGAPRSGRLLDVGCAAGFFLAEAQAWYEVQGVELSAWSSAYARDQLKLPVVTGSLQSAALPNAHFALITLWDVIEHVADPVPLLREAGRVLAPGGRIVLTTGDWGSAYAQAQGERWHLLTPPWHLTFFSRTTLAEAAQRAGLRVLKVASEGVAGDGPRWRNPLSLLATRALGLGDIMRVTLVH